jgi:protocatechuate 3,4-dioxygenase beta subunit
MKRKTFPLPLLLLTAIITLALWGSPFQLAAQSSSDGSSGSTLQIEKGSIAGRVTGIDSSLIGDAYVTAWCIDPAGIDWSKGSALVDSLFNFRIDSLAPGDYYVVAEATGYLPQYYPGVTDIAGARTVPVQASEVTPDINFVLQPGFIISGGTISGEITGPDGQALMYVSVVATTLFSPDPAKTDFQDVGYAVTDDNGKYVLTGLPANDYYVRADLWDSWYSQTLWYPQAASIADAKLVHVQDSLEVAGIDFHFSLITKTGTIQGQVLDALDQPIANAGIQITAAPNPSGSWNYFWFYASTDADGRYRIDNIPNGEYVAYCWAQSGWEYTQCWWPDSENMDEAKIITISDELQSWQIDFKLPLSLGRANISGFVRAKDGHPLANAYIQITSEANNPDVVTGKSIYAYASADTNGFYNIDKLPEGTYIAYASYWEDMRFGQAWYKDADSLNRAEPIILKSTDSRRDIDFNLLVRPIYGSIVGVVKNALTREPISRAYVEISYQQKYANLSYRPYAWWPYQAITDESGQFAMDWLPEGSYLVSVYANGGFAYYPDALVADLATPVKVVGGEKSETNFNLTLRNEGLSAISGHVKADYQAMPMRLDQGGKVARQAAALEGYVPEIAVVMAKPEVTIMMWPKSESFYTAVTDLEGAYTIKGLPAGKYYVMSFAPGHMLQYYKETFDPAAAELVKVSEGEVVSGIDFNLQPRFWDMFKEGDNRGASLLNASVTGTVVDENNQGVTGATIYLLDSQGQALSWATSDQNGRYEILGIAPGQYYIQAGKIGFATSFNGDAPSREQTTPVVVSNGTTNVNITLNQSGATTVDLEVLPQNVELYGNYPNPFNPETRIHFALPQPMQVTLTIYDMLGREIRRLQDGTLPEGSHRLLWDGRDSNGATLSSGVYWYRLATPEATRTGKMVLMR